MKKILLFIFCVVIMKVNAQDLMRITMNNGSTLDFNINNVDEINFSESKRVDIVGEWLWVLEGSIVRWNFHNDGTCSFYDYLTYIYDNRISSIDEKTGTYTIINNVITIKWAYGQTSLIEVASINNFQMVSAVNDVFYKVQNPAYNMTTEDAPITIGNEGDVIKYVDHYYATIEDNKIKAITNGSGYALVEDADTKELKAFRIDIEFAMPAIIDWMQFFNVSKEQIVSEFGIPDLQNDSQHTYGYLYFNASIQSVVFTFSENWEKTKRVVVNFYDEDKRQPYYNIIKEHYILFDNSGGVQMFYDPNNSYNIIYVNTANGIYRIEYANMEE